MDKIKIELSPPYRDDQAGTNVTCTITFNQITDALAFFADLNQLIIRYKELDDAPPPKA